MRKALWSAAALIGLSGFAVLMIGPAQAADTTVNMVDGPGDATKVWKFEPAEITVPAGTKVTWKNTGDQAHTATADDGSFDSGTISNGGTFSQVINQSVTYKCTPHPWMKGKITVSGGGTTPTTAASTTTTAAGGTTTTTTAKPTTTTTAKGAAAGGSTTTTTAGGGVTSTTLAPSVTPTSAPESAGVTTTTAAATGGGEESAAGGHGSEHPASEDNDKSSPLGIAFASVATLLLIGISGKLLASKS